MGRQWMRDRCVERTIRLYGKQDQRTDAWHSTRGRMVTASEVYRIFQTPGARMDVLLKKLDPPTSQQGTPSPPLLWGTRMEVVAKQMYEETTQCSIVDVGCCVHPIYPFLGASPDGIIFPNDENDVARYGRLVEFKCPFSRGVTEGIPIAYVYQMQMQMECTGIDECEYVEFRFKQVFYAEWVDFTDRKGFFAVRANGKVEYDTDARNSDEDQIVYWVLMGTKKEFVAKDPNWLTNHLTTLTEFWMEVEHHRVNGTRPELPQTNAAVVLDL